MEIDEEILLTKSGKKNPFTVPDGYFEHFTNQLMDSLPDPKEKKILSPAPKHNFYIYCAAAAACIVVFVALFCVSFRTFPFDNHPSIIPVVEKRMNSRGLW